MEQCECLPLNTKIARKYVLVKKLFNRQKVIPLFKVLSTGTNTSSALAATDQWSCWLRCDWTQPRQKLTAASDRRRLDGWLENAFLHVKPQIL